MVVVIVVGGVLITLSVVVVVCACVRKCGTKREKKGDLLMEQQCFEGLRASDDPDDLVDSKTCTLASYTEIPDHPPPISTTDEALREKYLPASVFKMDMDSKTAKQLLTDHGTPGKGDSLA